MSLLLCWTPRVTSAPTFSSKTACTQRRSVMHCGRPLSNPYFSGDLDPLRRLARYRQNAVVSLWHSRHGCRCSLEQPHVNREFLALCSGLRGLTGYVQSLTRSPLRPRTAFLDLEVQLCAKLNYAWSTGSRVGICRRSPWRAL